MSGPVSGLGLGGTRRRTSEKLLSEEALRPVSLRAGSLSTPKGRDRKGSPPLPSRPRA